ncbi:MAG: hypothetical protein AB8B74_11160 [Crocinitomicaceae bacterium]
MKINSIIEEIESNYDTKSVDRNGLNFWLEFRNRFFYSLSIGKESNLIINSSVYLNVIRSIFYGFFNWFKGYDCWVLSSSLNRVELHNGYYDKLFDYPALKFKKTLFIELATNGHYKRSKVISKHIVSRAPLIMFEKLISLFISVKKIDVSLLDLIQQEYKTVIDPSYSIKKMVSQYKAMKLLLRLKKLPKTVFIAPLYMSFGYVKALKERGVVVVEAQHGVINKEHFGYNYHTEFDSNYFPDYLLSFGEREKEVFTEHNKYIDSNKVFPVGSFYIDYVNDKYKLDIDHSKYRLSLSVSMQDCGIGSKVLPFLISVSELNRDCLFLLKPRRTSISEYKSKYKIPSNIVFVEDLDVYQTILSSDFHITAYSSCALEAPALGVQNILLNIENKAKEYYFGILDENTTSFVDTEEEFNNLISNLTSEIKPEVKGFHTQIIKTDYKKNIDEFFKLVR